MTIKKGQQALELYTTDVVGPRFISYILEKKKAALMKGTIIPDDLIAEMESFSDRNAIVEIESKNDGKICCPQCLKAYAFTKAKEFGLPNSAFAELGRMIKGKMGHEGYYLDQNKLFKI